jgi:hypothetical protein
MKRVFLFIAVVVLSIFLLSSCAAAKKDCHGVKHYKHKGGFYI